MWAGPIISLLQTVIHGNDSPASIVVTIFFIDEDVFFAPSLPHSLDMTCVRAQSPNKHPTTIFLQLISCYIDDLQELSKSFPKVDITYREQKEPGGVLQAAGVGLEGLGSFEGNVLVVPANMPLLQPDTTLLCLEAMIAEGAAGTKVGPPHASVGASLL